MKMTRRVFMLLLTMVMCLLLGTSAFADGYNDGTKYVEA